MFLVFYNFRTPHKLGEYEPACHTVGSVTVSRVLLHSTWTGQKNFSWWASLGKENRILLDAFKQCVVF